MLCVNENLIKSLEPHKKALLELETVAGFQAAFILASPQHGRLHGSILLYWE
jgi:hypothetical protein